MEHKSTENSESPELGRAVRRRLPRRHRRGQTWRRPFDDGSRDRSTILAQRSSDAGLRRRLNTALAVRWSRRRETSLEVLTNERGSESLVVGGELLLTTSSWAVPDVQAYVRRRGLEQAELGCVDLKSRLVRVATTGPTTTEHLEDTVAELRERGAEASLTHVTPLAPIVKPQSGVSVPTIGAFESYAPYSTGDSDGARVAVVDTGIRAAPSGRTAGSPGSPGSRPTTRARMRTT